MKKGMLIYDSSTNCFDVLYLECGKEKQPRRCKYGQYYGKFPALILPQESVSSQHSPIEQVDK